MSRENVERLQTALGPHTLRFTRFATLCGALGMVCLIMAAPAPATHPRPKGATPIRMPLVPAYPACTAPNRTHGPPLAFASCNPPAQASAQATVGTPDAFGGAANSVGYVRLVYRPCLGGNCFPEYDDMSIEIALSDVRCVPTAGRCGTANASGPADYSGEIRYSFAVRLTDHRSAVAPGGGVDPATVQDFAVEFSAPCVQSGSTSAGSTCTVDTSMNAVIPGAAYGDRRAIWALDAVRIFDGGADGDGDTTADNTVFARPGIFSP